MTDSTPKLDEEAVMSIWEHLTELRNRVFVALVAVVITSALSFAFAEKLIGVLATPLGGTENFLSIEVTENLGVYMRVSLLSGFIFALPVVVYEIVAYVMPGLLPVEKRYVLMAIPFATLLFASGVAFTFFIILPTSIPFLTGFLNIKTTPRPSTYIDFVTGLMFWVGMLFELPLIMYLLAKLGLVTARQLVGAWRYAIVIIAVVAAVVTPTADPINMGLLMLPLIVLYFLSIGLAAVAGRNPTRTPKEA